VRKITVKVKEEEAPRKETILQIGGNHVDKRR
jgi:hypothetical protein